MTRQEAEEQMMQKLKEIVAIYHEYNPRGKYLAMAFHRNCLSMHNEHWAVDSSKPINSFEVMDGKGVIQL